MVTVADVREWLRRHPRVRRVLLILSCVYLLGVISVPWAYGTDAAAQDAVGGPFSWLTVSDSNGISIWQYTLNIHQGSVGDPMKLVFAPFVHILWEIYRVLIAVACWLVNFVLDFGWVDVIVYPFHSLYAAIEHLVDIIGIGPFLLTVAGAILAVWLVLGRAALSIYELFLSAFVIALFSGALANPIDLIAGQDGFLYDGRDMGLEVSAAFHDPDNPDEVDTDDLPNALTSSMVDAFVRSAHQMTNYGESLETDECVDYYNEALARSELFPTADEAPREAVRNCSQTAFDHAESTGPVHLLTILVAMPATLLVLLMAVLLSVLLLYGVADLLWQGAKSLVTGLLGVVPGPFRGALLRNLAQAVIAWACIPFLMVFLTGYLTFVVAVFDGDLSWFPSPMAVMVFIDVLAAVGVIALWRAHGSLRKATKPLASMLAWRPSAPESRSGRTPMPEQTFGRDVRNLGGAAMAAYGYKKFLWDKSNKQQADTANRPSAGPSQWSAAPPQGHSVRMEREPSGSSRSGAQHQRRALSAGSSGPRPLPPGSSGPRPLSPSGGGPKALPPSGGATGEGPARPGSAPGPSGQPPPAGPSGGPTRGVAARAAARGALSAATGGASSVAFTAGRAAKAAQTVRGAVASSRQVSAQSQDARQNLRARLERPAPSGQPAPLGPRTTARESRSFTPRTQAAPQQPRPDARPATQQYTRVIKDGQVLMVPTSDDDAPNTDAMGKGPRR